MYKNVKNCKKAAEDENNYKVIRHAAAEPRNNAIEAVKMNSAPDIFYIHKSFLLLKILLKIATREPQAMMKSKASETV